MPQTYGVSGRIITEAFEIRDLGRHNGVHKDGGVLVDGWRCVNCLKYV